MKGFILSTIVAVVCAGLHAEPVPVESVEAKVVEVRTTFRDRDTADVSKRSKKSKKKRRANLPDVGTCSGAFVAPDGYIVTARHCIRDAKQVIVQTYNRRKYRATIVAVSSKHDLALLHIDLFGTPYFELSPVVKRGSKIRILGSPLSITNTLSRGVIAGIQGDLFYVDCAALPGNSGGPVFNESGQMIGVIISGFIVYMGATHLNVAQGPDSIYFFLKRAFRRINQSGR